MKEIRKKIEQKRLLLGQTKSEISRRSGVSRWQYINIINNDDYNFTKDSLVAVLDSLELKLSITDKKKK